MMLVDITVMKSSNQLPVNKFDLLNYFDPLGKPAYS